jgi:hypothetical protein
MSEHLQFFEAAFIELLWFEVFAVSCFAVAGLFKFVAWWEARW